MDALAGQGGATALLLAARHGHAPVVAALLAAGAAVNPADAEGPLTCADVR